MRRTGLIALGSLLIAGCTLLVDLDGLSTPPAQAQSDGGGAPVLPPPADATREPPPSDATPGAGIAFGGVRSRGLYANDCPCDIDAPRVEGASPVMLLAVSVNAHGEHLPDIVAFGGKRLGEPIANVHIDFTRIGLWIVPAPAAQGTFEIDWSTTHGENGTMMAAYYTGVDPGTPFRAPAQTETGESTPATVAITGAQPGDRIVSFFGMNDTPPRNGFSAERVGAGQVFRAQVSNDSAESQLALSDGDASKPQWSYDSDRPWVGIGLALVRAR